MGVMQMRCAWDQFLNVIPVSMRRQVDELGQEDLQELRLRIRQMPELRCGTASKWLHNPVTQEDLMYVVNTGSHYSPWSAASSAQGYLTIPGGHRIGLCGDAVVQNGRMTGFRNLSGVCIRIARDYPEIGEGIPIDAGSILILGPPGSGKTTLLRSLIRTCSDKTAGSIAVVDERGELFPVGCFSTGKRTDV
jgi:stage III sporulation protein AA